MDIEDLPKKIQPLIEAIIDQNLIEDYRISKEMRDIKIVFIMEDSGEAINLTEHLEVISTFGMDTIFHYEGDFAYLRLTYFPWAQ